MERVASSFCCSSSMGLRIYTSGRKDSSGGNPNTSLIVSPSSCDVKWKTVDCSAKNFFANSIIGSVANDLYFQSRSLLVFCTHCLPVHAGAICGNRGVSNALSQTFCIGITLAIGSDRLDIGKPSLSKATPSPFVALLVGCDRPFGSLRRFISGW